MDEHIFDKVQEVDMQKTMKDYYIDYAMSVIMVLISHIESVPVS